MARLTPEEITEYAQLTGYTEQQIADMTEKEQELMAHAAHSPRQSWVQNLKFGDAKQLIAYAVLVAFVWWLNKEPPVALLIAGAVLTALSAALTVYRRRVVGKDDNVSE